MARVLVVDDTADIRFLVRAVLEQAGHLVSEAASGRNALDVLDQGAEVDLVVLDVQMPDMDGWTTLESIRTDDRGAELPVVLCTVKSQLEDSRRGWELGCDEFMTKPFSVTDLAATVDQVLARSKDELLALRRERRRAARSETES